MSVSLTLSLPDLRPDTIRAAFDALLPPPKPARPKVEAPSVPSPYPQPLPPEDADDVPF